MRPEAGIPIPPGWNRERPRGKAGAKVRVEIYPFRTMEVGESVFIPARTGEEVRRASQRALNTRSLLNAKADGRRFTSRATEQDGQLGVRVWRIA